MTSYTPPLMFLPSLVAAGLVGAGDELPVWEDVAGKVHTVPWCTSNAGGAKRVQVPVETLLRHQDSYRCAADGGQAAPAGPFDGMFALTSQDEDILWWLDSVRPQTLTWDEPPAVTRSAQLSGYLAARNPDHPALQQLLHKVRARELASLRSVQATAQYRQAREDLTAEVVAWTTERPVIDPRWEGLLPSEWLRSSRDLVRAAEGVSGWTLESSVAIWSDEVRHVGEDLALHKAPLLLIMYHSGNPSRTFLCVDEGSPGDVIEAAWELSRRGGTASVSQIVAALEAS